MWPCCFSRLPVRSCAEPNMSFISKLPPISASYAAFENMWPFIRNFMARVSAQWRSLLAWWVSSCPSSMEGTAGSHKHGEIPWMLPSYKNLIISMYLSLNLFLSVGFFSVILSTECFLGFILTQWIYWTSYIRLIDALHFLKTLLFLFLKYTNLLC